MRFFLAALALAARCFSILAFFFSRWALFFAGVKNHRPSVNKLSLLRTGFVVSTCISFPFSFRWLNDILETGLVENKLQKVDFRALVTKFDAVLRVFHPALTIGFAISSPTQASHTPAATGIFKAF